MRYAFVIVDVFTDVAFGGNQLAVFPDGRGLSPRAMQALARETNFAETTFVLPPVDEAHTARLRIFTPAAELPFAGHPTVGSGAALVHLGQVAAGPDGTARLVLEEGVGPVTVDVWPGATVGDGEPAVLSSRLTLTDPVLVTATAPATADVAAVLSLPADDVLETFVAGVGLAFTFARLSGADAVDRAVLDRAAWTARVAGGPAPQVFFFAGELTSGAALYARMVAPGIGIDEDPATGSACAALVATLAGRTARDAPGGDADVTLEVTQGVLLGRPSSISATAGTRGGAPARVTVGGSIVVVADATMRVPAGL